MIRNLEVNQSKPSVSIQNEKEFRTQSVKTQCIMFGLYRTLHEIESVIKSTVKTKTG